MDEHLRLFLYSSLVLGSLIFINDFFGTRQLAWFMAGLLAFFLSLFFIFHGHFLSLGMVGQIIFSAFVLVVAGITLYYFIQLKPDFDMALVYQ